MVCAVPEGLRETAARNVALNAARDMVAAQADQVHLVPLAGSGARRVVLAADRARITDWGRVVAARRARVLGVVPDYLCLGWTPGSISICAPNPKRLVVRTGLTQGFAGERDLGLMMLEQLRREAALETEAILLAPDAALDDAELVAALRAWDRPLRQAPAPDRPPDVNLLGRGAQGVNVGPRGRARGALVTACAVAALAWAANMQSDVRDLRLALDQQRAANQDIARNTFGLTGPIVDMQVQVARVLEGAQAAQEDSGVRLGFPELLARAGQIIAAEGYDVTEMQYRDAALRLLVRVDDFATLETLRARLAVDGVTAEIPRSVGRGAQGVEAEVRVTDARGAAP